MSAAVIMKYLGKGSGIPSGDVSSIDINKLLELQKKLSHVIQIVEQKIIETSDKNPQVKAAQERLHAITNALTEIVKEFDTLPEKGSTSKQIKRKRELLDKQDELITEHAGTSQRLRRVRELHKERTQDLQELTLYFQQVELKITTINLAFPAPTSARAISTMTPK